LHKDVIHIDIVPYGKHTFYSTIFEELYIRLRKKEKRSYSDEQVAALPSISSLHEHSREWRARGSSSGKLIKYFKQNRALRILEVGCGNGWLCHRFSTIPGSIVVGVDINSTELEQAARVFHRIPNLQFINGDITSGLFGDNRFDMIVFAASIQYFQSAIAIIQTALGLLNEGGEVHVIDSPFYNKTDLESAQVRSQSYFIAAGFPQMANHYFHHPYDDLQTFKPERLNLFWGITWLPRRANDPFNWYRIRKETTACH
jgi:ubiquinone/menaquinone biosynthesis C-methylase UbiE